VGMLASCLGRRPRAVASFRHRRGLVFGANAWLAASGAFARADPPGTSTNHDARKQRSKRQHEVVSRAECGLRLRDAGSRQGYVQVMERARLRRSDPRHRTGAPAVEPQTARKALGGARSTPVRCEGARWMLTS